MSHLQRCQQILMSREPSLGLPPEALRMEIQCELAMEGKAFAGRVEAEEAAKVIASYQR